MIDSTARATRFEGDSDAPAYAWAPAEKPVAVSIPFPVITRLERAAVESFRSLTSKGSEIGGVLFGRVTPGTPHAVAIEAFEPVECDYAAGPLYRLSDAELTRLDRVIEQRAAESLTAVGFYRSHTRKGLSLDAADIATMDSRFTEAHQIALVIRPSAKGCTAAIFLREDGVVRGDASCQEFPFRAAQQDSKPSTGLYDGAVAGPRGVTAAPAAPRPAPRAQIVPIASRREPAEAPLPAPVVAAPEPEQPQAEPVKAAAVAAAPAPAENAQPKSAPKSKAETKPETKPEPAVEPAKEVEVPPVVAKALGVAPKSGSSKLLWITLGALVSVVLSVGFVFSSGILHRGKAVVPVAQDTSALALRVDRNGAEIVLTWNRDSEVIRKATKAVLQISDGPQHENVEMDLAQLRNGSIVYTPVTGDVIFKMEVTGAGQATTASESVRVLRTRPSPMPDDAGAPQTPAAPGESAAVKPGEKTSGPSAAEEEQPEKPVALAQASRPFRADSLAQRLRPATNTEVADAPSISAPIPTSAGVNLGNLMSPQAPPPVPAAAPAPVAATPTADKRGGQIVQAQLLKRRDPEYPKLARDAGAAGVVELVATIATDGHVKSVRVVKGHPLLRQAATDAVKAWIYRPTTLNGAPVESETQILLNFKSDR